MSISKATTWTASDDHALAWALTAAVRPHLSRIERDRIHVSIGVDETFSAIGELITAIVRNHVPLEHDLMADIATWLDCYRGQADEPRLRNLLAKIKSSPLQQMTSSKQRSVSG
ncbi:hypothetical protein LV457_13735 [Mycobacterium sp. MYCO198283]|uniref:hypothetical protein n=1 Tax=Mycobacterium sp. MYCO198283 TaxID=2883505 RepID=UPI001E3A9E30|nr:hypothetical protein [Mycobacterium sp. MYCO198283]MCG5433338.1 hypothetical protein [Mycobacterium sp. MYCO198283]